MSFKKKLMSKGKTWALTKENIVSMKIKPQTYNNKFFCNVPHGPPYKYPGQNQSYFVFAVKYLVLP